MDVLGPLRNRLRLTFAGQAEGVPAWETELERGDDGGFFVPGSAVWTVNGGMTPIAAGIRALLLQALHPGALAGVAEHSDYRADPLARLAGTIRWIFTVTYGDTAAARAACEHVRRRHAPVTGTYVDGRGADRRYSANDPSLAEWVHIAFTDAFLRSYEHFRGPVPPAVGGADAYVREWAVAGELMGVPNPPRSDAELRSRLQEYDDAGLLAGGPRVEEVVRFLREPPLDPMLMPGYRLLFAAVVDTLSDRQRALLGLRKSGIPLPRGASIPLPTRLGGRVALRVVGAALERHSPSEQAARRRLARLGQPADLTYPEHGLTLTHQAPAGYRVARERIRVGEGPEAFRRLSDAIMEWDLHRGAGLRVRADTERARPGSRVVSGFGAGPLRLPAPCRVVWCVEEPGRAGFGYGTLPGHPESGEESFLAVLEPDGGVYFELFAFSRPSSWLYRLGDPVASACQRIVTRGYLRAARAYAGSPATTEGASRE